MVCAEQGERDKRYVIILFTIDDDNTYLYYTHVLHKAYIIADDRERVLNRYYNRFCEGSFGRRFDSFTIAAAQQQQQNQWPATTAEAAEVNSAWRLVDLISRVPLLGGHLDTDTKRSVNKTDQQCYYRQNDSIKSGKQREKVIVYWLNIIELLLLLNII